MLVLENLTAIEQVQVNIYLGALIALAIILFGCLARAIIGPRIADRIVAVNMMGSIVMVMITILCLLLREGYLMDICIIYAMISFLAVVVITKVYIGVYTEGLKKEGE